MESVLLVDRLKQAIQDDFKVMREELDKTNQEKNHLLDKNGILNKLNKELKEDNVSLTKALKELKEKYDHLHGKLKRKQDEIEKKDHWWDRYRFTAETMIKKLRTEGSFSLEVLHEVSRDLVDIMEESSNKESNSSHSSQENEMKSCSKLATSKDRKKRVRYTEVSNHKGRVQAKELITKTTNEEKVNEEYESGIRKQTDLDPAAYPKEHAGGRIQTTARKMEKEKKNFILSSEKQVTADRTAGRNKENDEWKYNLVATGAMKKDDEEHGMDLDDDDGETCARYPLLTSTPMFSASNTKSLLSSIASHDLSIIPKDKENVSNPSETNDVSGTGVNHDKGDNSLPLTPAVPTIFENLLTQRTSLISNSNCTNKNRNYKESFPLKDKTKAHFKKDTKLSVSKDIKIEKLNPTEKDNRSSPSILRNFDFETGAVMDHDNRIDYPVASQDNLGSPSILALDLKPAGEEKCADFNAIKRKRHSSEEQMGIPLADQEAEIFAQPCKKLSRKNSTFKMPLKPLLSTSTRKQPRQAPISPESCSILLLSDEEEGIKLESSSVDMFANSEKSISKDLSNDKDVIEGKDHFSKTAIPCTSQLSKDQDLFKQVQIENDLLDEEFPGFRKPDELNYKNIEVVRKKGERAKLNGFSCRECEQYYGEMTEEERKRKLKHCSRHRAKYSPPPSTPPGFWNLSFPSTQEVIEAGMMVTGDEVPVQKPLRRTRKKRLLKPIPKPM